MKKRIFTSLVIILTFTSCNPSSIGKKASGLPYEVMLVIEDDVLESKAGKEIKRELQSPVPSLPSIEPSMKVSTVSPHQFDGMLTYVRNIVEVKVDPTMYTKATIASEPNKWAKNQEVLTVKAPDTTMLATYLEQHSGAILEHFSKAERNRRIALLEETYSTLVKEKADSIFGVEIRMPEDMTYFKKADNFLWASNNAHTGRTDMVMYSFPYTSVDNYSQDYLVAKRDSVMKIHMPGSFPNSYMSTEKRFMLDYQVGEQDLAYLGVLRGLWRMEGGDMMGGPFVSHFVLDEAKQRIIAVEGFVYAPETNKAGYLRKVEAALHTLRLP